MCPQHFFAPSEAIRKCALFPAECVELVISSKVADYVTWANSDRLSKWAYSLRPHNIVIITYILLSLKHCVLTITFLSGATKIFHLVIAFQVSSECNLFCIEVKLDCYFITGRGVISMSFGPTKGEIHLTCK